MRSFFRWLWLKICWWKKSDQKLELPPRRLRPEDCTIIGFTTLGEPIPPSGEKELEVGSGHCRCASPKFISFMGFKASGSKSVVTENVVPVLLQDVHIGVWSVRRVKMAQLRRTDEGPMECDNWPAFSNIEECRLILTLGNISDCSIHVFGKLYVVCECGTCSRRGYMIDSGGRRA